MKLLPTIALSAGIAIISASAGFAQGPAPPPPAPRPRSRRWRLLQQQNRPARKRPRFPRPALSKRTRRTFTVKNGKSSARNASEAVANHPERGARTL